MSAPTRDGPGSGIRNWLTGSTGRRVDPRSFRSLALACSLALTASYVWVLREVTAVVGGTDSLLTVVAAMLVVATVAAKVVGPRTATIATVVAVVVGFWYYLSAAGVGIGVVISATDAILADVLTLVAGLPLLRMTAAGTWTLAFVPGPVFLSWYLAIRRRYVLSVIPGGAALAFLVLTGDATVGPTLVGTVAATGVVGFGELERRRGTIAQADLLAVLFAVMMVLSLTVSVVPGGSTGTQIIGGGQQGASLDGNVAAAPDESTIGGSVTLSPEVHFVVESDEPAYWRTGVYDRFTGDGWVRSGESEPYDGALDGPPGEARTLTQTVHVEDVVGVMPMAAHPIDVRGDIRRNTLASDHGQFRPNSPLYQGDVYRVESAIVDPSPAELQHAGTDYPSEVEDRYLQLPEGTSEEFEAYTSEVTADADDPYETAVAIEQYLRSSKGYSLDVDRPDGNVAEAFLFEMDEGYCVYFATTMVQMLRAEDVPARYVTGYTEGQQVDDDEWVVRGLDAHAWVEVYFPGHGWVEFEPTPPDTRDSEHADRLQEAREMGEDGIDTDRSQNVPADDDTDDADDDDGTDDADDDDGTDDADDGDDTDDADDGDDTDDADDGDDTDTNQTPTDASDDDSGLLPGLPSTERLAFALVVLVGLVAGAHQVGAAALVAREVRVHWHGRRRSPDEDVTHAYSRLELLLGHRYRPRRPSETPRQYLRSLSAHESLDPRVRTVERRYERATYGDGVDRTEADETVATVDELARERLPVIGRRWR